MNTASNTIRTLWSRQQIGAPDVDYDMWNGRRESIARFAAESRSCIFTVDVYRCVYDYASEGFGNLLGIDRRLLRNISREGDMLEDMIHPGDRERIMEMQIDHGRFIYSLDPQRRNDYRTAYQWRMKDSGGRYRNVTSRQQVIQTDRNGKAWIIMGIMDLSPVQDRWMGVRSSVFDLRTGLLADENKPVEKRILTNREREILYLLGEGLLSKEIAARLGISINTVNNHRKNILSRLGADNTIEALRRAAESGLLS